MLLLVPARGRVSSAARPRRALGAVPRLVRFPPRASIRRRPLSTGAAASRPPPPPAPAPSSRPARDRVIEFGKYRGQMLGTLPPSYLRWVAAELDYGDTAPWARLARDVLADPVYVDRADWEHAHRFLRGDADCDYAYDDDDDDGPLQEMADRFGWDLTDEEGWSRLDLRLLGTSYGGRIPRKGAAGRQHTTTTSSSGSRSNFAGKLSTAAGTKGKRDERRERMRRRSEEQVRTAKMDVLGLNAGVLGAPPPRRDRTRTAKKEILGLGRGRVGGETLGERMPPVARIGGRGGSPFPGRQAFLDKVRKLKGDDGDDS